MLRKKQAFAIVLTCLLGSAASAWADDRPFGGLFADLFGDDPAPQQQQQRPMQQNYNRGSSSAGGYSSQQRGPIRAQRPAPNAIPDLPNDPPAAAASSRTSTPTVQRADTNPAARRSATSPNYAFQFDEAPSPPGAANSSSAMAAPPASGSQSSGSPSSGESASSTPASTSQPIHERLKGFRQSPFDNHSPASTVATSEAATPPQATATEPSASSRASESIASGPAMEAPATAVPQSTVPSGEPARVAVSQEPTVLIERKSPVLTAETVGPRKIVVGKEAAFEVVLQNSGEAAAADVTVTVSLPAWAEIVGSSASTGEVRPAQQDRNDPCRWTLGRIEARTKEKLSLRIVPRQSKPFELAVTCNFKQAPTQATIEVQEPKLAMKLDGPRDVHFGKREVYKLKLSNTGNGPAENVVLTLMPLSANETQPVTHRLGTIAAGDERSIEIELTARQSGNLSIQVEAHGDGGTRAELAERVLVRRATVKLDAEGPAVQYVGTPANYKIHVRNLGDAQAKNLHIAVKLPTGVKFVSGSDGAHAEAVGDGSKVQWSLETLEPNSERQLQIKCTLALSGVNRLEITTTGDDEIVAATESLTRVESMADLRLDVKDPEGPVPVGSDALYELRINNRGTRAAENVEILAYFSTGVEPISAEGQTYHISPGQVVFSPIGAIPPAAEVVIKVKARAEAAGNHVFRAEVHCKPMGTRLVREETTHFYQDGTAPQAESVAAKPVATPVAAPAPREEARMADRRPPLPLPQSSAAPMATPVIQKR